MRGTRRITRTIAGMRAVFVWALATLVVATVSGLGSPAAANLRLSEIIVDYGPGDPPVRDILAWNDGEDPLYVTVTVYEVHDPGGEARRERIDNPDTAPIVVSPQRFILSPGQRRQLRVVQAAPLEERERVFRINVHPQYGEDETPREGVRVLIAYDLLVMLRPSDPVVDIRVERMGDELRARNVGNASVGLIRIRQCRAADDCESVSGVRIHPGQEKAVDLPFDAPVEVYHNSAKGGWTDTY